MILLYLVVISLLCFNVFSDASISFAIAISSPCVSNLNLIGVFDFGSINSYSLSLFNLDSSISFIFILDKSIVTGTGSLSAGSLIVTSYSVPNANILDVIRIAFLSPNTKSLMFTPGSTTTDSNNLSKCNPLRIRF